MLDMGTALKEAEFIGDKCSEQKLRSILLEVRRVFETLFFDLKEKFPTDGIWKKLYSNGRPNHDKDYLRMIYKGASEKLGFDVIPDALLNVKPNHVKSVADYNDSGWRLRPAIMASLLSAIHQTDHPMYSAAKERPNLLDEIDKIAGIAGKGIHSDEGNSDLKTVKMIVENVYEIVGIFLKPIMEA